MIQFSIVYNYKKRLRKNGTAEVQIRAYQNGKAKYFSTGIFLTPYQWSKKQLKVIDHPNSFEYNAEIRRQLDNVEAFSLHWVKAKGSITLEQLEHFYRYDDAGSFTAFWQCEMEEEKQLTARTKKNHKTAFNHWIAFRKDVQFTELDFNLVREFDKYLHGLKLHLNTIYAHHKQVRRYINLAIKKGLIEVNNNPYLHFSPKTKESERTVLLKEEVSKLELLEFSKKDFFLEVIRDMFLFACYTGLRFSDLHQLRHENIEQDESGLLLNIVAQKTGKGLRLPLYKLHNQKPEEIIKKHQIPSHRGGDLVFYAYTNQYYNRALKRIAELAGINKTITSHVARHTFATHLASKVPLHILKTILQHSKIETTMVYVHLSNRMVNEALDEVSW
mgnify:CR=1 FL=1